MAFGPSAAPSAPSFWPSSSIGRPLAGRRDRHGLADVLELDREGDLAAARDALQLRLRRDAAQGAVGLRDVEGEARIAEELLDLRHVGRLLQGLRGLRVGGRRLLRDVREALQRLREIHAAGHAGHGLAVEVCVLLRARVGEPGLHLRHERRDVRRRALAGLRPRLELRDLVRADLVGHALVLDERVVLRGDDPRGHRLRAHALDLQGHVGVGELLLAVALVRPGEADAHRAHRGLRGQGHRDRRAVDRVVEGRLDDRRLLATAAERDEHRRRHGECSDHRSPRPARHPSPPVAHPFLGIQGVTVSSGWAPSGRLVYGEPSSKPQSASRYRATSQSVTAVAAASTSARFIARK